MFPKKLMTDVIWGFYGGQYESREKLIQAVTDYNKNFGKKWSPNKIVLSCTSITIQYFYWNEKEDDDVEENFNLTADKESGFTAEELLFKIHNQVVDKLENEDYHFFEGLTLWEGENFENPNAPFYFLNQGS